MTTALHIAYAPAAARRRGELADPNVPLEEFA
jgi:hypothetical protein